MKKNLKRLQPILTCLMVVLLLANCSTEERVSLEVDSTSSDELKSRFVSLEELEQMPKVIKKLNSLTDRGSGNKRLAHSKKYDFSVETGQALVVEKGKYTSLSFPIRRDEPSQYLENLFLHPHKDGYLAFLARYDFTDTDLKNLEEGKPIDGLLSKIRLTPLDNFDMGDLGVAYSGNTYSNGGGYTPIYRWIDGECYRIDTIENIGNGQVEITWVPAPGECATSTGDGADRPGSVRYDVYEAIVDLIGSQGGASSGGPGNNGGGGQGNNGNYSNNFYTPFNPVKPEDVDPNDPQNDEFYNPNPIIGVVSPNIPLPDQNCVALKNISKNGNFRVKMIELKNDAAGSAEAGMVIYKNTPNYSPKAYGALDSNGNSYVALNYDSSRTSEITGFMHCHLNNPIFKCAAVFSLSDIVEFANLIENSNAFIHEFAMYVTSDKGTFALKITDKQTLLNLRDYIINNEANALEEFEDKVKISDSPERQIKGFLQFLKGRNASEEVHIYQSDGNFQNQNHNWERKYLDGNKVKSEKC